jgi:DNA-binding MarR family transcriptional regulator
MDQDHVDRLLRQWASVRPDLDARPMEVLARVWRAARFLETGWTQTFGRHGLSRGEFDVLASLRRSGPPHRLGPTDLAESLLVSASAMTNRVDSLERAGLVARRPDPNDRRGVLVQLSPRGRHLVDRVVAEHMANQARLLQAFSSDEAKDLARLLRRLLLSFERDGGSPEGEDHAPATKSGRTSRGSRGRRRSP